MAHDRKRTRLAVLGVFCLRLVLLENIFVASPSSRQPCPFAFSLGFQWNTHDPSSLFPGDRAGEAPVAHLVDTGHRVESKPEQAPSNVLARICREAVARVRFNAFLRDMNVGVSAVDNRRTEILAQDLQCFGGDQFAVDVTGVLSSAGEPHPRAVDIDGVILSEARRDKFGRCPEVVAGGRCRLVVVDATLG